MSPRIAGCSLDVAVVRTDPFALRAELEEVALRGPNGQVFARAERASADLAWASLWRRGWIVERVHMASPQMDIGSVPALKSSAGPSATAQGSEPTAVTVRQLTVEDGRLRHDAAQIELEALNLHARDLSTLDAAAGTYETAARVAGGAGRIASRGTLALAPFAAEGSLSVAALRASRLLPEAKGSCTARRAMCTPRASWCCATSTSPAASSRMRGSSCGTQPLRAKEVPIPRNAPVEVAAEASVAPHGKVAAQGRVQLSPLKLHLNLNAESLPLVVAERWLPRDLALRIVSGTVSGTGLLELCRRLGGLSGQRRRSTSCGSRSANPARCFSPGTTRRPTRSPFDTQPFTLRAGEIALRAPEGRLEIGQDGTVNFARVLGRRRQRGRRRHRCRPAVERLRIEQGTLHFADRSLANPFEVTMRELAGAVTGFSTAKGEPARVRLNGRVQPYGVARIRGTIDLNAPTKLADITANLRNLRLEAFNPYIAKFAGYRIASGRLSATLRYEVRDGRLVGANQLAFENMQLGEKLERKGLVDLPLELAVALLADPQGRINLDIPVRGSLNDPQFDFGAIVAEALGNVVRKIVSAPFRALARLFGGGDDERRAGRWRSARAPPGFRRPPRRASRGSPKASPSARSSRSRCTAVRSGARPRGAAPARRAARCSRARAGMRGAARDVQSEGDRAGRARSTSSAAATARLCDACARARNRYGRALLAQLAAGTSIDPAEMQALARERAQAVRLALIERGVDPARVSVGEIRESPAAEHGVPTELALHAAESAAAGGTAPAPANSAVRQRKRPQANAEADCGLTAEGVSTYNQNRRASPHCSLVNLVRSGRKQPQPAPASAGGRARHLIHIAR